MTLRHSLACVMLSLGAVAVVPAAGQLTPQRNNNNVAPSPTAQASKQVQEAETNLRKVQAQANVLREQVKSQYLSKPEWVAVSSEVKKAEADMKSAERAALAALNKQPEYAAAVQQRDDARKVQRAAQAEAAPGAEKTVSDTELTQSYDSYTKAIYKMKAMEKQALADDQPYNDAKARFDAANSKMTQLDAQVDEALKDNKDYQQLQQQVTQAQQQVTQAKQHLAQVRQQQQQHRQPTRPSTPAYGGNRR